MNDWLLCLFIFGITYSTTQCLTVVPKRPNPPETFTSNVTLKYIGGVVKGKIFRDSDNNRNLESSANTDGVGYTADYQLYDIGVECIIFIVGPIKDYKSTKVASGSKIPPLWAFLPASEFVKQSEYGDTPVDIWTFKETHIGAYFEIGVKSSDVNRPVYLIIQFSSTDLTLYEFNDFNTDLPDKSHFDLPKECNTTNSLASNRYMMPSKIIQKVFQ